MNTDQIETLYILDQVPSSKFRGVFSNNLPDLAEGGVREDLDSLGVVISHDKFYQFLDGEYRYMSV